jgi:hypothetical protein
MATPPLPRPRSADRAAEECAEKPLRDTHQHGIAEGGEHVEVASSATLCATVLPN